nr:hypothetical protein [uncultured Campylobacter sp.]
MILKSAKDALELKFSLLSLAAMLRTVIDSLPLCIKRGIKFAATFKFK